MLGGVTFLHLPACLPAYRSSCLPLTSVRVLVVTAAEWYAPATTESTRVPRALKACVGVRSIGRLVRMHYTIYCALHCTLPHCQHIALHGTL